MKSQEKIWKELAASYVKEYGARLLSEEQALSQCTSLPTVALDARVQAAVEGMKAEKQRVTRRRRFQVVGALAAACFLLLIAAPLVQQYLTTTVFDSVKYNATMEYPTLSLSRPLPSQFTVSTVDTDHGQTIYTLEDALGDPVVMTMEENGDTAFFQTLIPVTLGSHQAYGRSEEGSQLLAFEEEGILYTLSCAYDLNTLAILGRSICT